ncbi:gamma-tubulin complex component 3 isoform X2 [Anabrus simplex]|uniref:gamma-tubulin complex component 3 isoform X2 n=1 Tax=Anabrus simplex TaxID=316456 RepID=UPI0035A265FB
MQEKEAATDNEVTHAYELAQRIMKDAIPSSHSQSNEVLIVEKIKRHFEVAGRDEDLEKFISLYRKLESSRVLKNLPAILALLDCVGTPETTLQPPPLMDIPQAVPDNVTVRRSFQLDTRSTQPTFLMRSLPVSSDESSLLATPRPQEISVLQQELSVAGSPLEILKSDVSEDELLQELVYAFQGIPGKILQLNAVTEDLTVNPSIKLSRPHRRMVLRLAELGWLHNQLRQFCNTSDVSLGLMEKGFLAALRSELTEYYRLVAMIQAQVQKQIQETVESPLTLRKLQVWALEPMFRLKWLVDIVTACSGRKAGALASCIHGYLQHGNPAVRAAVRHLLSMVCKPVYMMLSRWMLDGELEDPFGEFFIVADAEIKGDRLWHEKYKVQENLVPCFITMAQAKKILATGKSINFLREVCHDYPPIKGRDQLRRHLERTSVEALFTLDTESELQAVMDTAYLETSRRVLDVLNGPYMFMENLQALRRYLLLGQGDFIRHFMEIIYPELQKPASHLYPHVLSEILESAIRATNAQFENPDILERLDLRLLETSPGDTGWDVFSLDYHVDGPIGTIFGPSAASYLTLFNALWKSKRMEYVLTASWKRQVTSAKMLRKLPELAPLLQHTHLLTAEMIHFVHQMQYYTLFEVLECSWHTLIWDVQHAEALDDIIRAHNSFLTRIKKGALLDSDSQELSNQLRAVYELILQLQRLEEQLHTRSLEELNARANRETIVEKRGEVGQFGMSLAEEEALAAERRNFVDVYLPSVHAQLRVLAKSYQDVVKKFLLLLASHSDVSLQLLSVRLDFNEHYKRTDARLAAPYTYRRLSELAYKPPSYSK